MSIRCCHHCELRTVTCHDTCQRYKEEKAEDEKMKAWLKAHKNHIPRSYEFNANAYLAHGVRPSTRYRKR